MVDWLLLRPVSGISAIFRTTTQIYELYRNEDGTTGLTIFDCHRKSKESWVGKINLIFWSGFSILKSTKDVYRAGSMAVSKHVTHYDRLSGFSYYNLTALHRDSSYPPPGNVLSSSVGLSPGYLHQSWNLNSSYMIMSCLINILYFMWK